MPKSRPTPSQTWWSRLRQQLNQHRSLTAFLSFWFVYFTLFWSKAFWTDSGGNLVTGHINIWGDWAAHFSMGSHFVAHGLNNLASPFLINARLSYPFAVNWIAALGIKLGTPFIGTFVVMSWLGSLAIIGALMAFYKVWFKSTAVAILASLIFLFNGGLGFLWYFTDIAASPRPIFTLLNPPHEYTKIDTENIRWMSVIDSMVVPQRAFNLGFPIALSSIAAIWYLEKAIHSKTAKPATWRSQKLPRLALGTLLGALPIIHMHSFLATVIILGCWCIGTFPGRRSEYHRWLWRWGIIAVPAALLSIPLYFQFFASQTSHQFMKWYPGWLAHEYHENWFWWWFKNWGITPVLALLGSWLWIAYPKNNWLRRAAWIAPFWILFAAINLILFQPYSWDNTKLLVWASVGISGAAAFLLHHFWVRWSKLPSSPSAQILKLLKLGSLGLVTAVIMASGALDAHWVLRSDLHNYIMYTQEELELAAWVKENTPPDSRWLTSDQHNHWLGNLTGRQAMLAYRGWLWTHGYEFSAVERDTRALFTSPATNLSLLDTYQLTYIVIGPSERATWNADQPSWNQVATPIKITENYTIYQRK